MNRTIASVGIAAALVCGSAAPALAVDNPITAKIAAISSGSSQVSSPVTVKGSWSTKKLEVGQTFKVTSDVINWAYDFPFTLNDDTQIGSCKTDKGTLTCTVDNVPDSVAAKTDISGIWWTTARLQESVVGKKRGEISIGGRAYPFTFGDKDWDSTCDNDCNGGHYEDAKPENSKWGWVNPDGTTSWMITWIAEPGVKYSVHDGYTKLSTSVKCAKGDTWDPNTTVYISAIRVNDYTIEFTAPEGVKVCTTYTPEPMATPAGAKTATNVADVNGIKLERTIEVSVNGGTTGDGSTPPPSPSVSTPAPNPTTTTPVPVPSVSTPAPQSGTSTPSAKPSHSGTATPSTRPTVKAETPKPSETKLAKTGSDSSFLVVLVPLVAIIGTFIYLISLSRKDDN
jgi:viral protein TPX|nr:MAG TPA: hemagglutinin [Caudoviricetes sp.]